MSLPSCALPPNTISPPCEALTENAYNLDVGYNYRITVPEIVTYTDATGIHTMQFSSWADGTLTNFRTITNFNTDLIATANYVELQTTTVSGTVTDTEGTLVTNANVTLRVNSTDYSAVTDMNGYYSIQVAIANGYVMTVTHPNYQTYTSPAFNVTGPTTLDITLTSPTPHFPAWLVALPIIGVVLYFLWKK